MNIQDILHDPHGLWVFDNDGTLYRNTKEIRRAVEANMISFIADHYDVDHAAAEAKRTQLLERYNTSYTLVAMKEEGVSPDVFLRSTYLAVDPQKCGITRDDTLRRTLESIVAEKVVLTNNPAPFARMILEALGVADLFSQIYGMMEIGYVSKPHPDAFLVLANALSERRSVVYVDDQLANVQAAHEMGARTILVRDDETVVQAPRYYAHSLRYMLVYPAGLEEKLCAMYGVAIVHQLTLGNVCNGVYKVQRGHGETMILKVGTDARSIREIRMNIAGYAAMRQLGLSSYIPKEYAVSAIDTEAYILMEYCGEDFYTAVQRSADPENMYGRLVKQLTKMYSASVRTLDETHGEYLTRVIVQRIRDTYDKHIAPILGVDDVVVELLDQLPSCVSVDRGNIFTFSNWDLTPEDVYLTDDGLKYSDPHAEVVGVPMVDIGCFAGVARDAHTLPGSARGYEKLKDLAVHLAPLLDMSQKDAERYFYLGRVLQSFLSARFRLKCEPEAGEKIFHQGVEYLYRVLN